MCANKLIECLQHQSSTKAHDFSDRFANGIATAFFGGISQLVTQARFIGKAGRLDLKHLKPLGGQYAVLNDSIIAILFIRVDIPRSAQPLNRSNKKDSIRGSPIALRTFIILSWLFYKVSGLQINGYRKAVVKTSQYLTTEFIKFFNIARLCHEAAHHE